MGGIVGIIGFKGTGNMEYQKNCDLMLETIRHRALNKDKAFLENIGILGARFHDHECVGKVLAYTDTNEIFVCVDGSVFNILNQEKILGPDMLDAEIILEWYLKKGDDFLSEIDGSFSLAIWDGKQKKLLLAKDRLGTKPLYYTRTENAIIFASEIKAITAIQTSRKSVDLTSMNNFLSYGHVPNPDTLFKSIHQVQPGHVLEFKDIDTKNKQYWKLGYHKNEKFLSDSESIEAFHEIFMTAVDRRIRRYPEAGAFLSGGLDTSGVVAIMKKLKGQSFKVFTAGFEEKAYDETEDARIVANHLSLDQYLIKVKFDNDFPDLLKKIVWHHDAPFSDTSAIPSYYAAKLAKERINTVLTGDFPDQLIGGSGHHRFALAREKNDSVFKRLLRNEYLNQFVTRMKLTAGSNGIIDKTKRFLYRETFPLEEQRILMSMPVPPWLKCHLYDDALLDVNYKTDPMSIARTMYKEVKSEGLLNKLLYFDVLSYAVDDLMIKVERMTSAHALNAISPFHDNDLVEFILKVPPNLKIRGPQQKYIMREALRPMLPAHTLNKKKQGFAMPIGEWLVKKLSDFVREILLDTSTLNRGYFKKKPMTRMIENFLSGKTDYASGSEATIITLITIELWHRLFID
ncbi:MAG: asparagine synthase (glutamine-hydrolyzing) [Desulfobacula sp.]|nr:asparagine synthase (glutamine-hydrolyzing) [Desulfobacula sp.]